jgi:hypothetical protein
VQPPAVCFPRGYRSIAEAFRIPEYSSKSTQRGEQTGSCRLHKWRCLTTIRETIALLMDW